MEHTKHAYKMNSVMASPQSPACTRKHYCQEKREKIDYGQSDETDREQIVVNEPSNQMFVN